MVRRPKTDMKVPPQLIGVQEDALRINATAFKLQRFPTLIMASCSSQNQAMEIDFETAAGQEMIDYIIAQSAPRNGKGRFVLEYEGRQFTCSVITDGNRKPAWLEVCWKTGDPLSPVGDKARSVPASE